MTCFCRLTDELDIHAYNSDAELWKRNNTTVIKCRFYKPAKYRLRIYAKIANTEELPSLLAEYMISPNILPHIERPFSHKDITWGLRHGFYQLGFSEPETFSTTLTLGITEAEGNPVYSLANSRNSSRVFIKATLNKLSNTVNSNNSGECIPRQGHHCRCKIEYNDSRFHIFSDTESLSVGFYALTVYGKRNKEDKYQAVLVAKINFKQFKGMH